MLFYFCWVIILIFCFFKAEDIREINHSLGSKHRELTTLETNRKHQKEELRRREEDLRGLLENKTVADFCSTLFREKMIMILILIWLNVLVQSLVLCGPLRTAQHSTAQPFHPYRAFLVVFPHFFQASVISFLHLKTVLFHSSVCQTVKRTLEGELLCTWDVPLLLSNK